MSSARRWMRAGLEASASPHLGRTNQGPRLPEAGRIHGPTTSSARRAWKSIYDPRRGSQDQVGLTDLRENRSVCCGAVSMPEALRLSSASVGALAIASTIAPAAVVAHLLRARRACANGSAPGTAAANLAGDHTPSSRPRQCRAPGAMSTRATSEPRSKPGHSGELVATHM